MSNFEEWVTKHSPRMKWNFSDMKKLKKMFIEVISVNNEIDLESLKKLFNEVK